MIALVILIVLSLIVALLVAGCRYRPTRIPASVALFLLVIALLWPAPRRAGEASRRMQCKWNLQTIGLALHNYHDAYGCFPPAYIADEDGQPMHSWRVLVLPYLEHATLYEQYRFDEPWDGPNNCELGDQICSSASIGSFRCPSDWTPSPLNTNYVLITGEGTAWEDEQSPRRNDFTDGTSQTIMVVEIADSGIHWMEPKDLTVDQALRGINSPLGACISSRHPGGANVLFADGSVEFIGSDITVAELRKLLTYQGGEEVNRPEQRRR